MARKHSKDHGGGPTRAIEALTAAGVPVDAARLAQELALLAVRLDVTEEIDRLTAHVAAARALLMKTDLSALEVAQTALGIAGDICVFTNQNLTIEELDSAV